MFPGGQVILSASAFVCSSFINLCMDVKAKGRLKAEEKEKGKKCHGINWTCRVQQNQYFECGTLSTVVLIFFFSYKAMRD